MSFAAVKREIFDAFVEDIDALRSGSLDLSEPHYDEKALTLFLVLRFRAGADFKVHTNELALCELMGLSNRTENKTSIMSNLLRMQEDGLLQITRTKGSKFFWISLEYDIFVPQDDYTVIYKQEFDAVFDAKSRDKLLSIIYGIKRYKHKKTNISFASLDVIAEETRISKPTIYRGLEKLKKVFSICKATIRFIDGQTKEVNYYKSLCDGVITSDQIEGIIRKYYKNVKSITYSNTK